MRTCLAIRHVAFEDLGAFAPVLETAGFETVTVDAGVANLAALDPLAPDLFVVLGGPISAGDEQAYPFLKHERRAMERRLEHGRPTLGICLGAQLLARAAGARVYPGKYKEIGFAPIELTQAGKASCLAPFRDLPMTLHWHGDTFDLPAGATRLAFSQHCENQAFQLGTTAIGFQFHPETDARHIEQWLIGHAAELAAEGIDVGRIRSQAGRLSDELADKARRVIQTWLETLFPEIP
ncbi:glutamine amidotransferase [Wenzhouxiangella sediminis]|uniref:Glutamine amidotransferase n=1 Tax=Wenzhouxiangella sediminis TaxID=1792836 RepID=A0A3E1K6K6_9GAMM|nr:glutamine amidotransferase [Wenzhouxiangella sediminis]RFF29666.1 glutamine amidotransferase [Wenzhouxiangella sediminis]